MRTAEKIAQAKDLLRFHIRTRRAEALPHPEHWAKNFTLSMQDIVQRASEDLKQEKLVIAAYLPVSIEPPIMDALTALFEAGHKILVPVVEPRRQLSWVHWTPHVEFEKNSLGISEPVGERAGTEAFTHAHVRFIPALAYDLAGSRLGQGGGYYDRFLSEETSKDPWSFGIAFSREILDQLPADTWDAHLCQVITEEGIKPLGPKR